MKLYVANCSTQTHLFNYKLPERTQSFSRQIPAGGQISIDGSDDEINSIISQHEKYGFIEHNRIPKDFSGLCWSAGKEIRQVKIHDATEARNEFLDDRSEKIIEDSAVVMNNEIKKVATSMGNEEKDGFEMTIESKPVDPEQEDKRPLKKNVKVAK